MALTANGGGRRPKTPPPTPPPPGWDTLTKNWEQRDPRRDELEATLRREYEEGLAAYAERRWQARQGEQQQTAGWEGRPWLPMITKAAIPDYSRTGLGQFSRDVWQKYGFTPSAMQQLSQVPMNMWGRKWDDRAFYVHPMPLVNPRGRIGLTKYEDYPAVHEMAHAYSIGGEDPMITRPFSNLFRWTAPEEFVSDWQRLQNETDPRYARANELSHNEYANTNVAESYAVLIEGVMGDLSQLPPYMWKHYRGMVERGAPQMPMITKQPPPSLPVIWKNSWQR